MCRLAVAGLVLVALIAPRCLAHCSPQPLHTSPITPDDPSLLVDAVVTEGGEHLYSLEDRNHRGGYRHFGPVRAAIEAAEKEVVQFRIGPNAPDPVSAAGGVPQFDIDLVARGQRVASEVYYIRIRVMGRTDLQRSVVLY